MLSNPAFANNKAPVPAGFFVVDKPAGMSSAAVTNRLKWLLKPLYGKGVKIGHGGTLDPFATGLLPIGLGAATKRLQGLLEGPKAYEFTLTFGEKRTTDDPEGGVMATSDVRPSAQEIRGVLPRFTGKIMQMPPAFSALKVDGQRAYALARAGQEVVLAERQVEVYGLELVGAGEVQAHDTVKLVAEVSKGTYIRVLGRDIAEALGTVGYVSQLRRAGHGPFTIGQAVTLETLDKALQMDDWKRYLLPLDVCPASQIEALQT